MRISSLLIGLAMCSLVIAVASAGERGTPAEAQALLGKAMKTVAKEGLAKASAEFNDPKGGFQHGDLYVFCMDSAHKIVAHPDPSLRGTDVATMKDSDGKPFGQEMIDAMKKGGGTVEYKWMNPVTNKVEPKVSFLKATADGGCGVGAYK
jgi:cytochrome c